MKKMKEKNRKRVKLTVMITTETRNRLVWLQSRLRDIGIGFNLSTPGKLVDALVMDEKSMDILTQKILSIDLSNKDK